MMNNDLEDHAHAAQLVARHFLSRGFNHFLFYSDTDIWSYEERGEGFVGALKRSGHDCEWSLWHRSSECRDGREQWKRKRKRKWLLAHKLLLLFLSGALATTAASEAQGGGISPLPLI